MLKKGLLYFHTLKYLKFVQIYYRLFYFFYKPTVSAIIKKNNIQISEIKAKLQFIADDKIYFKNNVATFLNHSASILVKNCWNDSLQEKLWLYNLHYFSALNVLDGDQKKTAYALLERWIDENPLFSGPGWEPYPISLRIINIIKYALSGNKISERVENSLYLQARYLNKKCEYHLLGNHLFENFKALCFSGLFFDTEESQRWFRKGFRGLQKEINNQVLKDGGHFELSPMYHCFFLEGLLDLQNIFSACGIDNKFLWKDEIERMLCWLNLMKRTATEISYFNDSSNHISPSPAQLFFYAKKFGYQVDDYDNPLQFLSDSGYIVVNTSRSKMIVDVGKIGPDYLPGHAHADTLSFELYVDQIPVFVNLGVSCYGISAQRSFERGTSAHNTVAINELNSSDVWSGFRVGKRARIQQVNITDNNTAFSIQAIHDGYSRIHDSLLHERTLTVSENQIEIMDCLNKSVNDAYAYFHLYPNSQVVFVSSEKIIIQMKNNVKIQLETKNKFQLIENQYAESFGLLQKTKSIKVKMDSINPVSFVKMIWE